MKTVNFDQLDIQTDTIALDLGCGEGRHTIALAFEKKLRTVWAVDIDAQDLDQAKQKALETAALLPQQSPICWLRGDGLSLPYKDNSIDVLICSEVLEHIDDYESMLDEIKRVVVPNGYLAISVPRAWPEKLCWWLSDAYHHVPGGHVRIFHSKTLVAQIKKRGFSLYASHGAHALHVPYWWLKCLFWHNQDRNRFARWLISTYHRFLVWDMMKKPKLTNWLERLLSPFMGKSIVLYFRKTP